MDDDDFVLAGFADTPKERSKFLSYLSLPRRGENKKVVSTPVLNKLYQYFFNVEITQKTVITRETRYFINTDVEKLEKKYLK